MNLIVSAAIVLLNPYVTVYISYKIPPFALSVHIPDVSTSIYVEVDSKVLLGLPFCKHSVNHVFSSPTSIINFTSKKPSYDDTRRSGRDNELLQRAQNDL